jgi:hypothetical protein
MRPREDVLTPAEVETFWQEGYLAVRGVLSTEEVQRFRRLILDLLPRDLTIPDHWESFDGRIKPFYTPGNQTFDGPDFIPLHQNERLYRVMTQLFQYPKLRVGDGSIGITIRNDAASAELSQDLHLDPAVPEEVEEFLFTPEEIEIGGCYYLTDVEPGGGGIHVVPRGHRIVEEEAGAVPRGRQLHDKWRSISHLKSVEVTGRAGDFILMHHLMPHGASHNRRPTTRLAQFFRYVRDDQPHGLGALRPEGYFSNLQVEAMSPLGRKLLGVDTW